MIEPRIRRHERRRGIWLAVSKRTLISAVCAMLTALTALTANVPHAVAQPRAEVRTGHAAAVTAVAYAPDGKTFATSSFDGTIKIWNAVQDTEIRTLSGHNRPVFSVAYSPNGQFIASAGQDRTVRIWNANTGALLRTIPGTDKEYTAAWFMPDGKTLATIGIGVLRLWSLANGEQLRVFQIPESLTFSLRSSRDGRLISWGGKGMAYVLDVQSGKILWNFSTGTNLCISVAFSPDGTTLAVPVAGGKVELHDMRNGKLLRSLTGPGDAMFWRDGSYDGLAFSPDGHNIAAVHGRLFQWELASGRMIKESEYDIAGGISMDYSPDGHSLAIGQDSGVVGTIASGSPESSPASIAITHDQRPLFTTSSQDTGTKGVSVQRVPQNQGFQQADSVAQTPWSAAFSPDGKTIVSVDQTGNDIFFWNPTTGSIQSRIAMGDAHWSFVRFSADAKTLVLAGGTGAAVMDAVTHKELHRYTDMVTHPELSPDGRFLGYFLPDGMGFLIDLSKDKNATSSLTPSLLAPVTALAFSADSKSVAVGGASDSVVVRKLDSGRTQTLRLGASGVSALAYSNDGRHLAAAVGDGSVILLDLSRDGARTVLRKPGGQVYDVAFTPDGQSCAVIEQNGSIAFLNVNDGHETGRSPAGNTATGNLVFSPDGKRFLTLGGNSITLWNLTVKPIVSLYAFKDGSSVAMTPEGYYDASSESAENNVSVRVGGALYPISAYREKFYRPELVRLALKGDSIGQFARLDQVKVAPIVAILPLAAETGSETVTVKIKLTDQGGGIGQVRLFLNGSAVVEDALNTRGLSGGSNDVQRSYVVHLPPGENKLRAIAFNADNSMQNGSDTMPITLKAKPETPPALYAVVVGIQKFKNPRFELQNSIADAQLFASTLQEHATGLYSKVNIKTLTTPEETTRDHIAEALNVARAAVGPNDLFVFYVASHGVSDDGEYFLITSNVGSPSTERLKADALDRESITSLLANIPSAKKLIVIDTCQAGALGDSLSNALHTRGMNDVTAAKIISRAVGSTVLAATNSEQEALESYQNHGLFTYIVTQGLGGKADTSQSGYVTTLQLAAYVDAQVPLLAEKVFQHAQYPTAETNGAAFPVAKAN